MAKSSDTWMAFYPGAYLANTLHLNRCQHGSYILLILAAFKNGGWLPNDDGFLATIARCSAKEWTAERATYAAFFDVTDERWTHDRVSEELNKAERLTAQRSIAGTASATARQRNRNDRSTGDAPPLQRERRPSELQPENPSHGDISTVADRASASPDGPPRSRLPDSGVWAERLNQFKPWLPHGERGRWLPAWGPSPDGAGINHSIPPLLYAKWRAEYDAEMRKARGEAA